MRTGPHYTARWTKGLDFFASTQVQWKQGPVKLGRVYNSSNPYPMWLLALHVGRFGVFWHWHPPARRRWPAAPPDPLLAVIAACNVARRGVRGDVPGGHYVAVRIPLVVWEHLIERAGA